MATTNVVEDNLGATPGSSTATSTDTETWQSETWPSWLRGNFDKLLLTAIIIGFLAYQLHVLHDHTDLDAVHWAREQTNIFIGALVGLITGSRLAAVRHKTTSATTNVEGEEAKP